MGALQTQNFTTTNPSNNVAVGYYAGHDLTTGQNNTFLGTFAGENATTGMENTFLGTSAGGGGAVAGNENTAVGRSAGNALTNGYNNLLLGHDAGRAASPSGEITTASNKVCLGDDDITDLFCADTSISSSDERDKTDFAALTLGLDFVKALEPVTYYWDKRSKYGDRDAEDYDLNAQKPAGTHKEDKMHAGFKAQAVVALEEAAGHKMSDKKNILSNLTDDGKRYGLKYERFVPILVKAIQEQDAIIQSLTARIAALES